MATLIQNTYLRKFNEAELATVQASVSAHSTESPAEYAFQVKDKHWKYAIIATSATAGNITFKAGDSPLAGGDLVVPVKVGTNVIAIEDALVKINKPYDVNASNKGLLDVVLFTSSVALTNVMVIKLP